MATKLLARSTNYPTLSMPSQEAGMRASLSTRQRNFSADRNPIFGAMPTQPCRWQEAPASEGGRTVMFQHAEIER